VLEGELVIDSMEFNPRLSMSGSEDFQKLANSLEGEVSSNKWKLKVIKSNPWHLTIPFLKRHSTSSVYGDRNCIRNTDILSCSRMAWLIPQQDFLMSSIKFYTELYLLLEYKHRLLNYTMYANFKTVSYSSGTVGLLILCAPKFIGSARHT
jgi:hypothetical protein